MIKQLIYLCCWTTFFLQANSLSAAQESIKWQTNYEEALSQAKQSSKPLLLFFTGSDWCGWCNRLDEEAFHSKEFADSVGTKFVFLKLDFPLYANQDPQIKAQNKQLQQRFDVRSYPTVIIFDTQQNQQIGTTGYRPGGGAQYADFLQKMVNDYSSYKNKMGCLENGKCTQSELKQLYALAKKLHLKDDTVRIMKQGMDLDADQSLYFLLERYRYLADEGLIHTEEATYLRKELLAADPENAKQIPYQVAVVEFETYSVESESEAIPLDAAIAPLTAYIEKYGNKDRDNLWRLQMIVAQVYLNKNQMALALQYAQNAHDTAPASVRPSIARAVQNITIQLHEPLTAKQK